ncbi:hypothetical protein FV226_11135 [Methylobacterium sp. WL12]|uniref:hypothetical protein n=1 Tax=Methylobacterium sp. WL12 TaxID=2603890 RepID=UPI0011CC8C11|nr:hypothetical protein [Methylobacterium sp. WL12]TXM72894.1 hypothetical protein FV226_11135 [Methylobacterium sp. WL12]
MSSVPKLTPLAACRVARIDRDRLNEHVAAGRYPCAPSTVPGRARLFDPDDMVGLWLFRTLMDDGLTAEAAGFMACEVAKAARMNPEARTITFVQTYFDERGGNAYPSSHVPDDADWDDVTFGGTDIRKATTFNISKIRKLIAHYTEEERSIIGERE